MSLTYCSRTSCRQETCFRHQKRAPLYTEISIADLNDGCYLSPEEDDKMTIEAIRRSQDAARNDLLAAICRGTQKTNYKCDEVCKAMCSSDGHCAYCYTIADAVEDMLNNERASSNTVQIL